MAAVKPPAVSEEALKATLDKLSKSLEAHWRKQGQWGLAEDLAQEGLLKVLQKQRSWEHKRGSLDAFFYTVALNAGRDLLKKEATQKRGKGRIQQEAHRLLYFKMDGVRRRRRAKSDEPVVL